MRVGPNIVYPTLGAEKVRHSIISLEDYIVVRTERQQYIWWKTGILKEKMAEKEKEFWEKECTV